MGTWLLLPSRYLLQSSYATSRFAPRPSPSLPRLVEISQIWRRLVLHGGHQEAVPAEEIDFLADADMHVVLGAHGLLPPDRLVGLGAAIVLGHHPGTGQRVVDG